VSSPTRRLSNAEFQKQLAFGQQAETAIAKWVMRRGSLVLPIYDIEYDTGKGPRLFDRDGEYIAPDLLVINKHKQVLWIEAKHKTVFTWHRISKPPCWTTGIDRNHYQGYLRIQNRIDWPVWLLFLHRSSQPDARDLTHGCPESCPVGLFGDTLERLAKCVNHESPKWGRYGMVYWSAASLKELGPLSEFEEDGQG